MQQKLKILLVGGGTMGSVSPLLAVSLAYQADYLFIGTKTGPEKSAVESLGINLQSISSGKWRRYFAWQNIWDLFKIKLAFWQALKIIIKFKPDLVLTAGSFVCMPVAYAAWILHKPVIVHQQDIKIGLANKIMAPVAKKVTVTFPEQAKYFNHKKVVVTGNPVRKPKQIESSRSILITGGGLGARGFNDFIKPFLPQLLAYYEVHHVLGQNNLDQAYDAPNYHAHAFISDGMVDLIAKNQIIISRAGMSLISEAASHKKALLLVPLPDSHQEANAKFLAEHNAAIMVNQGSDKIMQRYLDKLLNNEELQMALGKNLYNLFPKNALNNYKILIDNILWKK